jgi:hypothetical protein
MSDVKPWQNRNDLLHQALAKAEQGLPVFPCNAIKEPCSLHGFYDASTDPEEIKELWAHPTKPVAMIAMPTGMASKRLVIDLDRKPGKADGVIEWPKFLADNGISELLTHQTRTPSTGEHLTFSCQEDLPSLKLGKLWPGIEVKANGSYVIIAPSPGYVRMNNLEPIPVPQWLINCIKTLQAPIQEEIYDSTGIPDERKATYGKAALEEIISKIKALEIGQRNTGINLEAFRIGRLCGGGCLDFEEAKAAIIDAATSLGLKTRDKVFGPKGTIARAMRNGMKSPKGPRDNLDEVPSDIREFIKSWTPEDNLEPESEPDSEPESEIPTELLAVPGLVGEIARFIEDSALRPQPAMALAAGLTLVGTAAGRCILGPTRSGTALYIICLAGTGVGKDHPRDMIIEIMKKAEMSYHIGPEQFMSMPAMINYMKRQPLSLCVQDEFGSYLKRINSKSASGFEHTLIATMQKAWSSTSSTLMTPEWAQTPSEMICAPSMSMLCFSTPDQFFEAMQSKDIISGYLNRNIVLETLSRPPEQKPLADKTKIPSSITRKLMNIYQRRNAGGNAGFLSTASPDFMCLNIEPAAEALRTTFVRKVDRIDDDLARDLMVRTPEIAIRLATIVTVGLGLDCIHAAEMKWAIAFAEWTGERLVDLARSHIADSENQAVANEIMRIVKRKATKANPWVKQVIISQALKHKYKRRDLEDIYKGLREAESLAFYAKVPPGGGPISIWYAMPGVPRPNV